MTPHTLLEKTSVVVMGLGLHGGGVATTQWLVRHGAHVTVTDLRSRAELAPSISALSEIADSVTFVLGEHREADFRSCDMVVVNPGVPAESPFIQIARDAGAQIENEWTLFLRFSTSPIIGVTGTRGKTTVATWIHHALSAHTPGAVLAGNTAENALLAALPDLADVETPVVAELSSFQLEHVPEIQKSPHVAVVTNLMRDHLNRHGTMERYAEAKANLFRYQRAQDTLVLPEHDSWTPFFLRHKTAEHVVLYDTTELGFSIPDNFADEWGVHNLYNLQAAAHAAHVAGVPWEVIGEAALSLPAVRFRQEVIQEKEDTVIVNDSTATTPDAAIAAIRRFSRGGRRVVLIAGGTDKELDFTEWADIVSNSIAPEDLILLAGSATDKMLSALPVSYKTHLRTYETLAECVTEALERVGDNTTVLFSPGATSFEKFIHEFDRGERFTHLVEDTLTPTKEE